MKIVDMVESQIIASIKKESDIDKAINGTPNIAFLLTGNLLNLKQYIDRLKQNDMHVFLHLDFIEGMSNSRVAIKYIAQEWKPSGIITTKNNLVKYAKEEGLLTIQRIFLIDHSALQNGLQMIKTCTPDAVEVLPALMPKIIDTLSRKLTIPLIVGGLISSKEEILDALRAGALAVSSGNPNLWKIDL